MLLLLLLHPEAAGARATGPHQLHPTSFLLLLHHLPFPAGLDSPVSGGFFFVVVVLVEIPAESQRFPAVKQLGSSSAVISRRSRSFCRTSSEEPLPLPLRCLLLCSKAFHHQLDLLSLSLSLPLVSIRTPCRSPSLCCPPPHTHTEKRSISFVLMKY